MHAFQMDIPLIKKIFWGLILRLKIFSWI